MEDPEKALMEVVRWWQDRAVPSESLPNFNHGSRIQGLDSDWNQVPEVIEALEKGHGQTTKALITLQHHRPGYAATHGHPSLCTVQFSRRSSGELDVVAMFRKQEMSQWWIVNVNELRLLLDTIKEFLSFKGVEVKPGLITTFASKAIKTAPGSKPQVAVTSLDRAVMYRPEEVRELVADLVRPGVQGKSLSGWGNYLKELIPAATAALDGYPVCVYGLKTLSSWIDVLLRSGTHGDIDELKDLIDGLVKLNERHISAIKKSEATDYADWRTDVTQGVNQIYKQIAKSMNLEAMAKEGL
jgi:hypothetical protein